MLLHPVYAAVKERIAFISLFLKGGDSRQKYEKVPARGFFNILLRRKIYVSQNKKDRKHRADALLPDGAQRADGGKRPDCGSGRGTRGCSPGGHAGPASGGPERVGYGRNLGPDGVQ